MKVHEDGVRQKLKLIINTLLKLLYHNLLDGLRKKQWYTKLQNFSIKTFQKMIQKNAIRASIDITQQVVSSQIIIMIKNNAYLFLTAGLVLLK